MMAREYILLGDTPAYGRHPARIEGILELLEQNHHDADIPLVQRAYIFAANAHQGALRRDKEPYLSHPLAVAALLCDMGLDAAAVAAGLLHDTVEDTPTTVEDISFRFGPEVAFIVDGVTKLGKEGFNSPAERRAANRRKLMLAAVADPRVMMVKLADRLHNMRTLSFMTEPKQWRIALETRKFFISWASGLDLPQVQGELEKLCRLYLEPTVQPDKGPRLPAEGPGRRAPVRAASEHQTGPSREIQIRAQVEGGPKHI